MRTHAIFTLACCALPACVDNFEGANVQFDLRGTFPNQASAYGAMQAGQVENASSFTFYAIRNSTDPSSGATVENLFPVQNFEVHPIIDLDSPCFIDAGPHVEFPGVHVTQFATMVAQATGIPDYMNPPPDATDLQKEQAASAAQRAMNIIALASPAGIHVVTSATASNPYPTVAADCNGSDDQLPPPSCIDATSNKRRLDLCQAAWNQDKTYFEGTDRILTVPLNGTTDGFVDGINPVNLAPVGGAQFFVDTVLTRVDAYAIYHLVDGKDGPGDLVLYGTPETTTRDTVHVHMVDPQNGGVTAEVAIFPNIGKDDVHF